MMVVGMILAGAAGCNALVTQPQPPITEPDKSGPVVSMAAPPSATATNLPEETHLDEQTATSDVPRAPRCRQHEARNPPAGALAWISDCRIKIAKPIQFGFNSDQLRPESELTLQAVVNILHDDNSLRVEIGAHSDSRGSVEYNRVLTQQRADAVRNYLLGRGIDADRLMARGYGEQRPISHPPEINGRRTNRRIEFVILPE